MSSPPASPRGARLASPTWLDGRLVLGVLLVLVSVVVGAKVLSAADASQDVWAASHDLAAGSTLASGDLKRSRVRLFGGDSRYLAATGAAPVGYVLARGVGAAELLPRLSLTPPQLAAGRPLREVSVPIDAGHLPEDLQAGQQVDVYLTPTADSAQQPAALSNPTPSAGPVSVTGATRRVLSAVPVRLRPRDGAISANRTQAVVLSVTDTDAALLVAAVQQGKIDLVRLPRDAELAPLTAPSATPS